MSRSGRIAIVLGMLAAVVFLVVWAAFSYVGSNPATVSYLTGNKPGQPVHLVIQTDGAVATGAHPTWVSYRVRTPKSGEWVHTTLWELPAHTKIDVTEYQFDSGSPLRNQQWGRVTGTTGTKATLDGRTFKVINSYATAVGHTFTVPSLGISVPFKGVDTSKSNFCTSGPCTPVKQLHYTETFSFTTPGPGNYHFQCFIPCGGGFYAGNGGAMGTVGYMGGFLEVRA
ncbi:MAG: hypothetical protein ACRDWE_12830 [Acidimicrobiales bacterium]